MRSMTRRGVALLIVIGTGCDTTMTETQPPQIGKLDGTDRADRDCQVVLREVGFKPGSPYAVRDGWIVWQGHVDVAADALSAGAEVGILYHRVGRPWFEIDAVPPAVRTPGIPQNFGFEMWEGISSGSEGGSNWSNMKVELIPFLRMVDGSRVFDHNKLRDDFGNYLLDYSWGPGRRPFELDADPNVCPQ